MSDQKNFLLAIVLSLVVLLVWQEFFVAPQMEAERQRQLAEQEQQEPEIPMEPAPADVGAPPVAEITGSEREVEVPSAEVEPALVVAPRVDVVTPRLSGSITLRGGRIDDIVLSEYFDRVGEGAENIRLLRRIDQSEAYFAEFGWRAASGQNPELPGSTTLWRAAGNSLTPETPLILTYEAPGGLTFTRTISVDEDFMFTIRDEVRNESSEAVAIAPYAMIVRKGEPQVRDFYTLHEGPLGVFDGKLVDNDIDYKDVREGPHNFSADSGWIGFVDKYWLTAAIPDQGRRFNARYKYSDRDLGSYTASYVLGATDIAPGATYAVSHRLFAGAKEVDLIDHYTEGNGEASVDGFGMAIDWGWYPFLTKPIFLGLQFFNSHTGNFGIAILLLTVLIKLALYPLANKSYVAMSKMKKIQPKMKEIQERFADDKARQQQEIVALYKRENANPMAGCLPLVVQIPVFFALYKTLFMSIEMRHQPFFGWIQDLSAPDPATLITLFGLVPWDAPGFLMIGAWPLIMGATMILQQKMNPQPADPVQAKMMMLMPIMFMFILASFPVGLVIYWTWNNILSMIQQWTIMRRMGVSIGGD